jgi:hypothetical protein
MQIFTCGEACLYIEVKTDFYSIVQITYNVKCENTKQSESNGKKHDVVSEYNLLRQDH